MINKTFAAASVSIFMLSFNAIQVNAAPNDPISKAVSGKTLVDGSAAFKVRKNGKLTGKAGPEGKVKFKGTWAVRDGKWCRTFSEPERFEGTECQAATLGDGTITLVGKDGPRVWQIK